MDRSLLFLALGLFPATACAEGELFVFGHLAVSGAATDSPDSWRRGGLGRWLDDAPRVSGHLGLQWQPAIEWDVSLHARLDSDARGGADALGLVEASASRAWFQDSGARWRLKAGQFFLPTSREAIDPLWQSPYHLNLSALNSWIGEEFRPIGADVSWRNAPDSVWEAEFGATVFGGNDSAGALLAWRGFASHDRLSVLGEVLTLPGLPTIADEFSGQRDDGTKPFGPDLDGRLGHSIRGRLGARDRWRLLGAWTDNRGDRALYRGEYAWATRFAQFGAEWWPHADWTIAAEHMIGHTGMGLPDAARVDARFKASYLLASWQASPTWRWSWRAERFRVVDQDGVAEDNGDRGSGFTMTVFHEPDPHWRIGLEAQVLDTRHAASVLVGAPLETGGRSVRAEVRYRFP